jgi:hypothetical protein
MWPFKRKPIIDDDGIAAWLSGDSFFAAIIVDEHVVSPLSPRRLSRLNLLPVPEAGQIKAWRDWFRRVPRAQRQDVGRLYKAAKAGNMIEV